MRLERICGGRIAILTNTFKELTLGKTQQREDSHLRYLQDIKPKREELFKAELQASIESI